jgi:hypothetical protein
LKSRIIKKSVEKKMSKRKLFSIALITCFVTLMLALTAKLPSTVAMAAHQPIEIQNITAGDNHLLTATLAQTPTTALPATNSTVNINHQVVALVMQPTQEEIHAFSALTGEWTSLGGEGFRVSPDDVAMVSKLVVLVAQPGPDQIHAFSALTGQWATLSGEGFRVNADDVFKVNDSVIVVTQPGTDKIHAFSALTGQWATLDGESFNVSPDDIILVGPTTP